MRLKKKQLQCISPALHRRLARRWLSVSLSSWLALAGSPPPPLYYTCSDSSRMVADLALMWESRGAWPAGQILAGRPGSDELWPSVPPPVMFRADICST